MGTPDRGLVIRIYARAVIIRVDRGEGTVEEVIERYTWSPEVKGEVAVEVYSMRPDLQPRT